MIAALGWAGMLAALVGAILLVVRGIRGGRSGEWQELGGPTQLLLSGAVGAMAALLLALIADDFSLVYTANHHSSLTPFPYDIATAWAALEGSIVLWGLVLAGYTWFVFRHYRRNPDALGSAALAVMGGVAIFFFGLMVTVANPFEICVQATDMGCAASSPWPCSRTTS
jgi:cytochrome c-type biogenesis protein CcmF